MTTIQRDIITESNWTRWNHIENEPKFHQYWFEIVDIDFWYWFGESFTFPIVLFVVLTYLGSVWWAKRHMEGREPYKLRTKLFLWNVFVGLFSITALYRVSSEVLVLLNSPQGFYKSVCLREGLHMSTAYWAVVICFFKPLLIFDTLFLILRKKPVDAAHVIHHTMAIIFAPILVQISEPFIRWVGVANLFVHSVDYPLLALRSLKISVPKSRQIMAALEVAQMIFVLILSAYTLVLRASGTYCLRHPSSVKITYSVYFGLLAIVVITLLSPEYWKRGIKTIKKQASKIE